MSNVTNKRKREPIVLVHVLARAFLLLSVAHVGWAGQFTIRTLYWRLKRYESCRSDLREWRKHELLYYDEIENVLNTTSPMSAICVFRDRQLALELAYYTFPRVVIMQDKPTHFSSPYIVEESCSK